ncbi:MAG: bifunctional oligoribonuclease/PAP phosphatase NrnA [Syntrophales bacterium]
MDDSNNRNKEKLAELYPIVREKRVLILAHDNPDPDALASAFALKYLLSALWRISGTIAYGGIIGRAENKAMVKYLKIDLRPVSGIKMGSFGVIALIDSQPGSGNNSLPESVIPDVIIDHHMPVYEESLKARFHDIRTNYGSTSSILAGYLIASGLSSIDPRVATALFYGIRSDTRDLGRETGPQDIAAYSHLYRYVPFKILSRIEHPRLPRDYFRTFERAISRALIDRDVVISDLEQIYSPDALSEIADLLIRVEGVQWALCIGEFHGDIYFSLRTFHPKGHAGSVARKMVRELGSGGGHRMTAGGKITYALNYQEMVRTVIDRFLKEIRRRDFKGERL